MKALAWHGKGDIRCEEVPDPKIEHPRDAVIKVIGLRHLCGAGPASAKAGQRIKNQPWYAGRL